MLRGLRFGLLSGLPGRLLHLSCDLLQLPAPRLDWIQGYVSMKTLMCVMVAALVVVTMSAAAAAGCNGDLPGMPPTDSWQTVAALDATVFSALNNYSAPSLLDRHAGDLPPVLGPRVTS